MGLGLRHGGMGDLMGMHDLAKGPPPEPTFVGVEARHGKVEITVGDGVLVYEPDEAMRLGRGIVDAGEIALRHVSPLRK